jgi:hypothetical protein
MSTTELATEQNVANGFVASPEESEIQAVDPGGEVQRDN